MTERPFIAKSHEVRAILAGRQTQFRRVVRPVGRDGGFVIVEQESGAWWPYRSDDGESMFVTIRERGEEFLHQIPMLCPYGQPGDKLWVREAWRVCGGREYEYQQDRSQVMYHATHQEDGFPLTWESYKWRPSIFMPRWASRITLEITGVRVERLQDISEADAMAEGVTPILVPPDGGSCPHVEGFRTLWESINGDGSWAINPWVWVVEFKVEAPNA